MNSITLANALNDSTFTDAWAANATASKAAIQSQLWMDSVGMFRDNTTTDMAPQDGNALALLYNLTVDDSQKQSISKGLTAFWGATGAVTPERLNTISPFVGGFEVGSFALAAAPKSHVAALLGVISTVIQNHLHVLSARSKHTSWLVRASVHWT